MIARMIRAAGARTGDYDEDMLAQLYLLHGSVDRAMIEAIGRMRRRGVTWERIGAALGVTRQAALQRWGGERDYGAQIDRLSRGDAVKDGPGACAGCHHAQVWHRHHRPRRCEVGGCECADFTQ